MKKILTGLFFIGGFLTLSAQSVSFDKTTIDYGKIQLKSDGFRYFTITNKGDKPLIISNVKPGCGCTTPSWDKAPILPGKSSKIKVGYNTELIGPFRKLIEVSTNDPEHGRSVLWIQGEIIK